MRGVGAALVAGLFGCRTAAPPAPPAPAPPPPKTRVEAKEAARPEPQVPSGAPPLATVDDTAVVALRAPGFDALPREQRLLAYWLAQAARAGDAIAWDQGYRHNLE